MTNQLGESIIEWRAEFEKMFGISANRAFENMMYMLDVTEKVAFTVEGKDVTYRVTFRRTPVWKMEIVERSRPTVTKRRI